jgi:hypothetical protein
MNIKKESTLERSHFWPDALVLLVCYAVLLCLLTLPNTTQAQVQQKDRGVSVKPREFKQKVALIIGNADYDISVGKLKNPMNDATDMAAAFTRLEFKLVNGKPNLNVNKRQMLDLIREFGNQIRNGGVGVFYFAGHGVQIDKHNYLIPITDSLQHQEDAEFEAVDIDRILRQMEDAGNALNILILDACRNNNLPKKTRNTENGLGEPQRKPSGIFIAFAARDGQTALENPSSRNGLYTQELLKYLETPNLRLEDIFINTRREVKRLSNRTQEPIEYGSIDDVFYFKSNDSITMEGPSDTTPLDRGNIAPYHFFSPRCKSATINGDVQTYGAETFAWFEWGDTPDLGNVTIKQRFTADTHYHQELVDLKENTTYFYRAMASNINGTAKGRVKSFTTARCKR